MSMKKFILLFSLAALTSLTQAQDLSQQDNKKIDEKVDSFLGMIGQKNYTGVLDLMYPKFFEHQSKAQIFQVFQLMQQAGIDIKFNDFEVLNKELIPSDDAIKYALIEYRMDLELPLATEDLKGMAPMLVPMIESSFGKSNVEYNQEKSFVRVNAERFLMGVDDKNYDKGWMFLIYDTSFKSALDKTLPAEVNKVASAKAYK
jgi:hypothetical protein